MEMVMVASYRIWTGGIEKTNNSNNNNNNNNKRNKETVYRSIDCC